MNPTPLVDVGTSTAAITVPSRDILADAPRETPRPRREAMALRSDPSRDSSLLSRHRPSQEASEADYSGMTEEEVALALPDPRDDIAPAPVREEGREQSSGYLKAPAPRAAAVPPVTPIHPAPPKAQEKRYAGLPPALPGVVEPPAAPQAPGLMPSSEIELRHELKRLGVTYADMPPIHPGGACGIDYPVKVMALSGGIQMRPPAVLNAKMAVTFAKYVRSDFAPAVRWRYFSGIRSIRDGSYSCRNMIGESTHHLSEHAKGNAIDVMGITLDSGRVIDVEKPGWFSFRERGFLNKVRGEACGYFTTVLGPGYNWAHHNHFHFDLMRRRSGYVACR
ncbi:MAG TPA: extensin family protein [Rhizobiaceae bacterium]|nr:extensin family protein [Rhizobiaceae bacterium]